MKSRLVFWTLAVALLSLAGVVGAPLANLARREIQTDAHWELQSAGMDGVLGQGVTVALLGGFRTIAADWLWLETNAAWEQRDLPATQSLIRVVQGVDPRPLYFWINGARMVAYDMPYWRIAALGERGEVPVAVQKRIDEEQARLGLEMLGRGLAFHPGNPRLLIEQANIHLNRRHDIETAAALYRLAAERPGAPYYAARVYAALLMRLGRNGEAYQWLCEVHPGLPVDDEAAMAAEVLMQIRSLEGRLGVPDAQRYHVE